MRSTIMAGALALIAAPAAAETPITLKDPAVFEQQMREMGYAPEKSEVADATVSTVLHLPNETLALVLGGCSAGKDCTYVALVGAFNDVTGVSAEFVGKVNADYDLIKVWKRSDGKLAYSAAGVLEGLPRASFKAWIDAVTASTDDLARETIKAGYGPKK